jgi:hypothetical protein
VLLADIANVSHELITDKRRAALIDFKERLPIVRQLVTLKTDLAVQRR